MCAGQTVDAAFQKFWAAESPSAAAKAIGDIEKSKITFDDAWKRLKAGRAALSAKGGDFAGLLGAESLRIDVSGLRFFAHWITPAREKKRFDTRFFLARAPQAQDPLHDDGETIEPNVSVPMAKPTRPAEVAEAEPADEGADVDSAEIEDEDGNTYLDFEGGPGVVSVGHCHPAVVASSKLAASAIDGIRFMSPSPSACRPPG